MSILSKLFNGGENPMEAANPYLNQIPGVAHQGYDPYVQSGGKASHLTQDMYEKLMSDPTAFINSLMGGYTPSEGYNFQRDQLTKELSNTAAAGGIAGTPMDQMNQGQAVQKLLAGDQQQFLNNILNAFGIGLSGEEGIANRGFQATGALTDTLGNALNQQGGLAFQNAQQKNKNRNDMWNTFGKALGQGAGVASQVGLL